MGAIGVSGNVVGRVRLSGLEMLAEGQGLLLIGRAKTDAIEPIGYVEHPIIHDLKKCLTVMNEKGDIVRAHLEHDLRAFEAAVRSIPEAGIEEAGIVGA